MKNTNKMLTVKDVVDSKDWKNKNKMYLKQLQKFFDLADNIEDEKLKKIVIGQMLKVDETLTQIIEEICENTCNNNKI